MSMLGTVFLVTFFTKLKLCFGLESAASVRQGCQMAYFQTKNLDLGKLFVLIGMANWSILQLLCGRLVNFMINWCIFPVVLC
jgi:hypothetical protein